MTFPENKPTKKESDSYRHHDLDIEKFRGIRKVLEDNDMRRSGMRKHEWLAIFIVIFIIVVGMAIGVK